MILPRTKRLAVAVLAAGSSRRFGDDDKLLAPFSGRRLGEHAISAIHQADLAPAAAFVVDSQIEHPCQAAWAKAGFTTVVNLQADQGLGASVSLAATIALKSDCDALLIALADMPMVPPEHFSKLICASKDAEIVASAIGARKMVPAVFGHQSLDSLVMLSGDRGARDLLKDARIVDCPPEWLVDIDTPNDLHRYGTD